jgi:hypothetical protein
MKPLNYRVMMGYELDQRKGQATDLYLDFCTLREPDQFFPQYLALIGIGKSAYVDARIELLARTGLDVRDAVPNSFALYAAYRNAYGTEGGTVLLLDVGSDNMDMAFIRGGKLIFARNASSGARVFDGQLSGVLNLSMDDAERLKVARANLGPGREGEEEDEIRGPIRSAAGQISGFITSSINHAKVQLNDRELAIDKIYLSGGGARVAGLPEYLQGALKIPVELLDPFRKMDTSTIDRMGGEEWRRLPTDVAVAIGLGQLVSPPPGQAGSTLSILPDGVKKRRNFFRRGLWLGIAGAAVAASLLVLTVLAFIRKGTQESALEKFQEATKDVKSRIREMDELEIEMRDLAAKIDSLLWPVTNGRGVLDIVARLKKTLPREISLRDVRLTEPGAGRQAGRAPAGGSESQRVAVNVKGRGLVIGEVENTDAGEIRIRGQQPIAKADVLGDPVYWASMTREVTIVGEVDENIRGGPREALNALKDQLSDPSRGVKASSPSQRPSDKPGWRMFEIRIEFE